MMMSDAEIYKTGGVYYLFLRGERIPLHELAKDIEAIQKAIAEHKARQCLNALTSSQ